MITFSQAFSTYFERKAHKFAEQTKISKLQTADLIVKYMGDLPLNEIKLRDIERLYDTLEQDGGYKPATIRKTHTVLRQTLRFAVREELLEKNVAEYAELPPQPASNPNFLNHEDALDLLQTIKAKGHHVMHLYTRLLLLTGRRRNELLGLRWGQIDSKSGVIVFDEAVIYVKKVLSRKELKNGLVCQNVLPSEILKELLALRAFQKIHFNKGNDLDYIFLTDKGELYRPTSITRYYKRISAKKPYNVTPHTLRHTVASYLFSQGYREQDIAALLGHKDSSVTRKVYIHHIHDHQLLQRLSYSLSDTFLSTQLSVQDQDPSVSSSSAKAVTDYFYQKFFSEGGDA
ncbi:MAG: site-specific integrase [Eubacteriales bacterium]|nr:site-specific integrase [Eubacteriales bacterium]